MTDEKRPYRMTKRAEGEEQTRLRITESAMKLHGTLGPARSSISAIAEHAGVRRSTVYRHFPDENALFAACTAHWMAANPPPDVDNWTAIANPETRLSAALAELYIYYRRTEPMMSKVHRDEDLVPFIKRMMDDFRAYLRHARVALTEGRSIARRSALVEAALGHAVSFHAWRSLALEQGLEDWECAVLMRRFVDAACASETRG